MKPQKQSLGSSEIIGRALRMAWGESTQYFGVIPKNVYKSA
jgi:hypothetical protein